MSIRGDYEAYKAKHDALAATRRGAAKLHPGKSYQEPFQMFGNLYYVGDKGVCAHIVDTGDGLLLFDSVDVGNGGMLIHSIWKAGFNPENIKWVVHSHGHIDHIGQAILLKDMFGCKLYLGAPDAKMFRERPELSYMYESLNVADEAFTPDLEINDGDVIRFGNTEVKFLMVPGHTDGCIAAFFDVTDGKQTLRAGYYGGFGFNTLGKNYLIEIGDPTFETRNTYLNSLAKVRNEHVDVFMGNHPVNNRCLEKYEYQKSHPGENPFVDSAAWGKYLDEKRDALLAFMADPKNN